MGIHDRKFFPVPMLAVLLLVVGCSSSEPQVIDESKYEDLYNDDETNADADPDSDDDAESDDDSEGLDDEDFPEPPELPDAVKEESEDGAIAAAEYFMDAYEYAYRTADFSALEKIVDEECETCNNLREQFEADSDEGVTARDSRLADREQGEIFAEDDSVLIGFSLRLEDLAFKDADGEVVEENEDADYLFVFQVTKKNKSWKVTGADFQKE